MLHYVPDQYWTQEMCIKAVEEGHGSCILSLITLRPKECVLRQLRKTHGSWVMSLTVLNSRNA